MMSTRISRKICGFVCSGCPIIVFSDMGKGIHRSENRERLNRFLRARRRVGRSTVLLYERIHALAYITPSLSLLPCTSDHTHQIYLLHLFPLIPPGSRSAQGRAFLCGIFPILIASFRSDHRNTLPGVIPTFVSPAAI